MSVAAAAQYGAKNHKNGPRKQDSARQVYIRCVRGVVPVYTLGLDMNGHLKSAARVAAGVLAVGVMSFGGVGAAYAATILGLTNTGVDVNPITSADTAWDIVFVPGESSFPLLTYPSLVYPDAVNGEFPIPPWVPNSSTSMWDTPFDPLLSNTDPIAPGSYVYQTQFTVIGTLAATNTLSFIFAADNEVSGITLNGNPITSYTAPASGSSQYTAFSPVITAKDLMQTGLNTLQFDVVNYAQNGGNPSGLNVEFSSVTGVPEPSTWAMMLAGFGGLGFAAFRRSHKTPIAIA